MNIREKTLWIKALHGNAAAYRKLGIVYLTQGRNKRNRELAGLCLKKAMELGDESGYFIYHSLFSRGKQVIDDRSYDAIWEEYRAAKGKQEKRRLGRYLYLGTRRQKRRIFLRRA